MEPKERNRSQVSSSLTGKSKSKSKRLMQSVLDTVITLAPLSNQNVYKNNNDNDRDVAGKFTRSFAAIFDCIGLNHTIFSYDFFFVRL